MKLRFKLTCRKKNILKIIYIIKNWNIDYESINLVEVLDVQDSSQCNHIVKKFFKHIQNDLHVLLEVPFVKLKRKLIKSANFSLSYEKTDEELNQLVFDNEFCNFMIQLAPIYIQNSQIQKTELLFELLFENVTDGDVLANISLQILQNP